MEDAAVISKIIGQLEDAQIPDEMPESVREVIKSLPKEQKVQLDQYLDMVEGR